MYSTQADPRIRTLGARASSNRSRQRLSASRMATTRSSFPSTHPARQPPSRFPRFPASVFERSGPPVHHVFHDYVRTEAMIPMRDGVKLHAVILKPSDIAAPLPILLERTPTASTIQSRASFFAPCGVGARRLHLRGRRHSRAIQERGQIRHDAPARRSRSRSHRRKHRHL